MVKVNSSGGSSRYWSPSSSFCLAFSKQGCRLLEGTKDTNKNNKDVQNKSVRNTNVALGLFLVPITVFLYLTAVFHDATVLRDYDAVTTSTEGGIVRRDSNSTTANDVGLFSIYYKNDVVEFDTAVMDNIRATYNGAKSYVALPTQNNSAIINNNDTSRRHEGPSSSLTAVNSFHSLPLSATVDRRPLIVRKQLKQQHQHRGGIDGDAEGSLLGCAISSTTFISNLKKIPVKMKKRFTKSASCDVCFQFSNRQDMTNFVPSMGYEELLGEARTESNKDSQLSTATKCFRGTANVTNTNFADWQQRQEEFHGFGYPWVVDCELPNGTRELTCRQISKMEQSILTDRDDIRRIYFKTELTLSVKIGYRVTLMSFHSSWPWAALMSHDDNRSKISESLSKTWDDVSSSFVPINAKALKLAHVEGPGYVQTDLEGRPTLKSMNVNTTSMDGLHNRLLTTLFHFIRNAPGSTHMIAVVDGQAHKAYENLLLLLRAKVSELYPTYGRVFQQQPLELLQSLDIIPMSKMNERRSPETLLHPDLTLMELLQYRKIKILMIPFFTPSLAFEKTVCGGQYSFTSYLAARYSPDYHVIIYADGDTAMVEGTPSNTVQDILYERFFSAERSDKCVGHRMKLIEQFVKKEDEHPDRVLACTQELYENQTKWNYAMTNCHLAMGHVVARTDSIHIFNVHHPSTLIDFVPDGVEDCATRNDGLGEKKDRRFFLTEKEFIQLHLRDRERKSECTCFMNS